MSRNETVRIRANKTFIKKLNELYPQENDYNTKTLKLKDILDEMLHGRRNG